MLGWWVLLVAGCVPEPPDDGMLRRGGWSGHSSSFPQVLTLGVVPQQTPVDIESNWGPLADLLGERLGRTVLVKTASSIPEFERRCAEGRYDLAYMNPYHYVVYAQSPGYEAVARQKDKRIQGIMVVRADAETTALEDLANSALAFPSPAAFAASLLTRAELTERAVAFEPVYVRSHDSVYKAVADGLYPAGGGVKRTFAATDPDVREQLRILWTTDRFTPHALAVHPRVPEALASDIQAVLATLDSPDDHPDVLGPIKFNGWVPADDADWDDVRALGLTALVPGVAP